MMGTPCGPNESLRALPLAWRLNFGELWLQAISETVGAHYVGVSGFLPAGVCFLYGNCQSSTGRYDAALYCEEAEYKS